MRSFWIRTKDYRSNKEYGSKPPLGKDPLYQRMIHNFLNSSFWEVVMRMLTEVIPTSLSRAQSLLSEDQHDCKAHD